MFAFHFDNQINGKLTIGSVNSAQYTEVFVHTNVGSFSCWQVMLCSRLLAGAIMDVSLWLFVGLLTTIILGLATC